VGDPVKKLMPRPRKPVSSSAEKALRRDAVDHQSVNVSQTILGVEERIQGSQVNLETASEFSKKSWLSKPDENSPFRRSKIPHP